MTARREPREERSLNPAPNDRFEALFADHAGRVYAYARRRTSSDEAEEVVAETFLVAWRRLNDIPDEPFPWLVGVARKVMANRWRAAGRRLDLEHTLERPASSTGPDPGDEVQTKLDVLAAIDRLPPAEREALTLSAWDGLTAAEASTALGCSRATFAVRLHRARRRLVKELGGPEHTSIGSTARGNRDGLPDPRPAFKRDEPTSDERSNEEAQAR